jgi:DNA-binding CsgD family transcriptional regulator
LFFVFGAVGLPVLQGWGHDIAEMMILSGFNLFDFGVMVLTISTTWQLVGEKPSSVGSGRLFIYFSLACGLLASCINIQYIGTNTTFIYMLSATAILLLVITIVFPFQQTKDNNKAKAVAGAASHDPQVLDANTNKDYCNQEKNIAKNGEWHEAQGCDSVRRAGWKNLCVDVARLYGLSRRETEIFLLIAKGRNAEYVQKELTVSIHTAKTHISNIYHKLGVHSSQELLNLIEEHRAETNR